MTVQSPLDQQNQADSIETLLALRRFDGEPAEFWPCLIKAMATTFQAQAGVLVTEQEKGWVIHGPWLGKRTGNLSPALRERILSFAPLLVNADRPQINEDGSGVLVGASFPVPEGQPRALVVLIQVEVSAGTQAFCDQFHWLADIPATYAESLNPSTPGQLGHELLHPYEIALDLNQGERFQQVAMALCNEMATRFNCDQVSLGWWQKERIQLQASSHIERFDAKMELVQELETAMEEALDQDREIVLPLPGDDKAVVREHQHLASVLGMSHLLSLPLRWQGQAVAVVTCVRHNAAFTEQEIAAMRMALDLVSQRLTDLQHKDRWFVARWWDALAEQGKKLLGPEHTLAKLSTVISLILVAILTFGSVTYRVEAPFILRTEQVSYQPAPFDGYVDQVMVKVGDQVVQGGALLRLDTEELRIRESSALADLARYAREEEKARAAREFAEMQIAAVLKDQAQARLDEVRYFLGQAVLTAPFSGVVVEGELKKMLGAPVNRGEVLLKVASLDGLYLELDLDERDAHEVQKGLTGEMAFISQPDTLYNISVQRIEPQAVAKAGGNVFLVRAQAEGSPEQWWRPGMSGVAKIEVGERNLWWIMTHRTVAYLRMLLWW